MFTVNAASGWRGSAGPAGQPARHELPGPGSARSHGASSVEQTHQAPEAHHVEARRDGDSVAGARALNGRHDRAAAVSMLHLVREAGCLCHQPPAAAHCRQTLMCSANTRRFVAVLMRQCRRSFATLVSTNSFGMQHFTLHPATTIMVAEKGR